MTVSVGLLLVAISIGLLALVVRDIPVSVAYAVWSGRGHCCDRDHRRHLPRRADESGKGHGHRHDRYRRRRTEPQRYSLTWPRPWSLGVSTARRRLLQESSNAPGARPFLRWQDFRPVWAGQAGQPELSRTFRVGQHFHT